MIQKVQNRKKNVQNKTVRSDLPIWSTIYRPVLISVCKYAAQPKCRNCLKDMYKLMLAHESMEVGVLFGKSTPHLFATVFLKADKKQSFNIARIKLNLHCPVIHDNYCAMVIPKQKYGNIKLKVNTFTLVTQTHLLEQKFVNY